METDFEYRYSFYRKIFPKFVLNVPGENISLKMSNILLRISQNV